MAERLLWEREGRDWPHRGASRFIEAGGLRWHVQIPSAPAGQPVALLLHGTGATTHSWRGLLPLLAKKFAVVAPDLPGHGFSGEPTDRGFSLPQMAASLDALLKALSVRPVIAVGHSAGAAILAKMCLDRAIAPQHLISLNGALLPFGGLPGELFSPMARLLSRSSIVPRLFAWRATNPLVLNRLLSGTGSVLDAQGSALYGAVIRNSCHAAAALQMMAQWDLRPLRAALPGLRDCAGKLTIVVGSNDLAVDPTDADVVCRMVPGANLVRLPGLGHLAHEEQPALIADIINRLLVRDAVRHD